MIFLMLLNRIEFSVEIPMELNTEKNFLIIKDSSNIVMNLLRIFGAPLDLLL